MKKNFLGLFFIFLIAVVGTSVLSGFNQPHGNSKHTGPSPDTSGCDPKFWQKVYNPGRLKVINNCLTVSGVITESSANQDGDHHMLLRLDKGQENLLNRKNNKSKQGLLVLEIVCAHKVTEKKVGRICNGYTNTISIPRVGDHVKVTGSLVLDSHNGWNEIHPVTKITIQ